MRRISELFGILCLGTFTTFFAGCTSTLSDCGPAPGHGGTEAPHSQVVDLPATLASGHLRGVNREAKVSKDGTAIRVAAAQGFGVIWITNAEFADGILEADVCGRDVDGESFIGLAFHRKDDRTFEAVYVRPFNFRAGSADRRQHAVQYVAEPDFSYAPLRAKFPGEFEHAADPALVPTAWIRLRVIVHDGRVRVFVGQGAGVTLDVRQLRTADGGQVGLYVDNGSDGAFANVRIIHAS